MFNKRFTDETQVLDWQKSFNNAKPFRFLVIDDFLEPEFAIQLAEKFPTLEEMNVNYKGINERKSEHSDFDGLPAEFSQLKKCLAMSEVTTAIETITQIRNLELINDRFGFGLHQGGKDSFLDIHVDYNLHPIRQKQRRMNLILFLNLEWQQDWGGALEFWNKDVTVCEQSILPRFNRCVLFECNEYSFHGYSRITCPQEATRKSFYQYYFTNPQEKIVFHDTIFKSKPSEPIRKKIIVSVKETVKNSVKKIFYYSGLKKLLK